MRDWRCGDGCALVIIITAIIVILKILVVLMAMAAVVEMLLLIATDVTMLVAIVMMSLAIFVIVSNFVILWRPLSQDASSDKTGPSADKSSKLSATSTRKENTH